MFQFLSTLSLRRATSSSHPRLLLISISIHALLAESDPKTVTPMVAPPYISIHALLAESDTNTHRERQEQHEFLSTLSLRRATLNPLETLIILMEFLSTLSLRRATHPKMSDHPHNTKFLSTLSLRRATFKTPVPA